MQRTVERVFFALIRFDINGDELCEDLKKLITPEILPILFKLSKKHDLAHLIGDALDKNGLLEKGSEEQKKFLRERELALFRYMQQQSEFDQICHVLENAKIPFIPLKGSVIRDLYPEPWMRTSCDIDILVHEKNLETAVNALKGALCYEEGVRGSHDVNLFAPNGVHLELHFSLTESEEQWKCLLRDVWLKPLEDWQYRYVMSDEIFYFYHIVHMAIHMRTGGCGVKPFLDLQILNKKIVLSREELGNLLNKSALELFERESLKLSNAWFLRGALDEIGKIFQEYVLHGGVYGTIDNRVAVQQIKKGGKFSYLLSRIFVSFGELSIKYPSLKKRKMLFPFYQIYRWFDLLINKKSRQYTKATINSIQTTSAKNIARVDDLMNKLGI